MLKHYYLVFSRSETNLLGMLHCVYSMTRSDPLPERLGVVAFVVVVIEDQIHAGLVNGHRIGGGQHTDVSNAHTPGQERQDQDLRGCLYRSSQDQEDKRCNHNQSRDYSSH